MGLLRIVLQLVILGAGGIALAALISQPNPDIPSILGFLISVAFLLALTLALKAETKARLLPSRHRSFKPMGMVLLLAGAFCLFYGVSLMLGSQPMPDGTGTCRAVCGLLLLVTQLFGQEAAKVLAFGVWSGTGLFLCFMGNKLRTVNDL